MRRNILKPFATKFPATELETVTVLKIATKFGATNFAATELKIATKFADATNQPFTLNGYSLAYSPHISLAIPIDITRRNFSTFTNSQALSASTSITLYRPACLSVACLYRLDKFRFSSFAPYSTQTPINYPDSLDNLNTSSSFEVVKEKENDPFYNIIPSVYVYKNDKPISIHFNIFEISTADFSVEILSKLVLGSTYTVFIRIKYNINEYFMAGNQFGFIYSCKTDVDELQLIVHQRLEVLLDEYNISAEDIRYVMISFRQKDQKLLSEFSLNEKDHISTPDFKLAENKLIVPVSVNEESLGIPLRVITFKNQVGFTLKC